MFGLFKKQEEKINFHGYEINFTPTELREGMLNVDQGKIIKLDKMLLIENKDEFIYSIYDSLGKYNYNAFEYILILEDKITPEMKEYLKRSSECYLESIIYRLKYHNEDVLHTDEYKGEASDIGRFYIPDLFSCIDMAIMGGVIENLKKFLELYNIQTTRFKRETTVVYDYIFALKEIFVNNDDKKALKILQQQKQKISKNKLEYPLLVECLESILIQDSEKFQFDLEALIKKKKKLEAHNHDLFVIWPTLWSICIIAKRRGLKFEVDNRFLPKYCLESYE